MKPIANEKEWEEALKELDILFDTAQPETQEGDRLLELCEAIERYEMYNSPLNLKEHILGPIYLAAFLFLYYVIAPYVYIKDKVKNYLNKKRYG